MNKFSLFQVKSIKQVTKKVAHGKKKYFNFNSKLQFWTILFPNSLCVTEKRTYSVDCQWRIGLSIPFYHFGSIHTPKRVWIDWNDKRVWIDQNIIDGPRCMYWNFLSSNGLVDNTPKIDYLDINVLCFCFPMNYVNSEEEEHHNSALFCPPFAQVRIFPHFPPFFTIQ